MLIKIGSGSGLREMTVLVDVLDKYKVKMGDIKGTGSMFGEGEGITCLLRHESLKGLNGNKDIFVSEVKALDFVSLIAEIKTPYKLTAKIVSGHLTAVYQKKSLN